MEDYEKKAVSKALIQPKIYKRQDDTFTYLPTDDVNYTYPLVFLDVLVNCNPYNTLNLTVYRQKIFRW